ncbi:MAG: VCBS repeat-containing protein [Verrucomicrobia bacterium]|nr:VCBS repeat-containing protein [Verrucomicrobiota bacterium]
MNALSALNKMVSLSAILSAISMWCATQVSAAPLEWTSEPGGRSAPVRSSGSGAKPVLELIEPAASGIRFTNHLPAERHLTNQILLNGSGVTAGDVDGDGWCDLFFAGLGGGGRMFRNLGGWRFEDITVRLGSRLSGLEQSGVALVDLDGDGDLDLVVNSVGGGTHWLSNDGKGSFTPTGEAWNARRGGSSVAFGDMDGDGDLDAYIANYRIVTIRDQPNTRFSLRTIEGRQQVVSVDGVPISDPELANRFNFRIAQQGGRGSFAYDENGEPDVLLRNDGAGRWTPVAFTAGSFLDEDGRPLPAPLFDWGLSVAFRDINQDGAPDIYVCNDFRSPDRLWINNGRGVFRAAQPLTLRQISLSSMGVDFADVNRDGWDDFLVVDMLSPVHARRFTQRIDIKPELLPVGAIENRPQYPRNTFFLNRGDGSYAEAAQWAGLDATEWSWTPVFVDVDLDGYEDLLVSNGFERDGMNMDAVRQIESAKRERTMETVEQLHLRRMFPRLDTANMAFRNLGNGAFTNVSTAWGFDLRGVSHGMCLADLDNDGDLDCVVNNLNAPAYVYRNNAVGDRIAVRLRGKGRNTRGIGARIQVTGGPVAQSQEMMAGGRYLSSDDSMRTFAAGREPMRIEVTWRSGRRSVVENAKANRIYEVDEASSVEQSSAKAAPVVTHFTDVSGLVNHRHVDEAFDDFALQPTLSKRLSQSGPGVAWFDVDGDGWDDLLIGSGRGGTLAVFRNDARGGFVPMTGAPFEGAVSQDQTTVLGLRTAGGERVVLVGSANYENGQPNEPAVRAYRVPAKMMEAAVPGQVSSSGPMAMADVDGDGELDLFVGGRAIHGKFPVEASSQLYRQRQGKFVADPAANEVLTNAGLVSGAVFSDLDADGDADLVLACEWGPLKVFRNERRRFVSWDALVRAGNVERIMSQLTGWWNGVTTGDFDGDGRMDIAASNWGRNTRTEMFRARPLRLFHGEASGDGSILSIEAYTDPVSNRLLPMQPFHGMGAAVPAMRERMGSYENYANATLPEIYGESWKTLHELNSTVLDSMIFLNRGDHFEARSLPVEASSRRRSPVCAGDLDGDGFEDLFLSQNFFAVHPEHSRLDGGRGLWLRGRWSRRLRGGGRPGEWVVDLRRTTRCGLERLLCRWAR